MPQKGTLQQTSFTGGEVSPSLYGRVDLSRYISSLRTCRNFFIRPEGGVSKRAGTQFICEVKDHADETRIIPFEFSTTQTYILEFGDQYMRVIKDGGQVLEASQNITGITNANPGVVTVTGHSYTNGDHVYVSGVGGMTELNQRTLIVANATTNTFTLTTVKGVAVDTTNYTAYTSGGTVARVYEIATPYSASDAQDIKFAQSADVLYIAHPSHAPRKLSRTSDTSWTLSTFSIASAATAPVPTSATYSGTDSSQVESYVITTIDGNEESIASTPVSAIDFHNYWEQGEKMTVTWSAATGADAYNIYRKYGGIFGFVGTSDTTTFTDVNYIPDTTDTPPENYNPFSGADKYPSNVSFFQDRLAWSASNDNPQTVWLSQTANYANHDSSRVPKASDAIEFTINARQVNKIRHMVPLGDLILLTSGAVWGAGGQGENEPISPASIKVDVQSYSGCADVPPILISDTILYVEDKAQAIRDLYYQFSSDKYTGSDLSIMSRHLFEGYTIRDWGFAKVPHSICWACRSDGSLLGLTYVREHEVWGWHRHDTADGIFENVATVSEGSENAVYFVVKRTLGGQDYRFIERMASRHFTDQKDAFFVDSGLTYNGAATSTLTGLWHLEGETVKVLADGNVLPDKTVTNGAITLTNAASKASVGLGYTADLETLDINVDTNSGALRPRKRAIAKVFLDLKDTRGLFVGQNADANLVELKPLARENYTDPIALRSGIAEIVPETGWDEKGRVFIQSQEPLPAEILSIMPDLAMGGS